MYVAVPKTSNDGQARGVERLGTWRDDGARADLRDFAVADQD
jgi:hypothetical protein